MKTPTTVTALLAATALAASTIAAAPPVGAAGCASRAEYRRVKANSTETPAKIQSIFGIPGRRVGYYRYYGRGGVLVHVTVYRYTPACNGGKTSPVIYYRGWQGHAATAYLKRWI